jgi:hypothetical protein
VKVRQESNVQPRWIEGWDSALKSRIGLANDSRAYVYKIGFTVRNDGQ